MYNIIYLVIAISLPGMSSVMQILTYRIQKDPSKYIEKLST